MNIRKGKIEDLHEITAIENECFPASEAATEESFKGRLTVYPDYFWDEMYENPYLHNPEGKWQMIFGVNTLPDYRKRGYAGKLINELIEDARAGKRKGVVLTCKDTLVSYYSKFGFKNEGVSESTHGGVVWYEMRLIF